MRVSDEELEMLAIKYTANYEGAKDKFETFHEYALNYVNTLKREMKELGYNL